MELMGISEMLRKRRQRIREDKEDALTRRRRWGLPLTDSKKKAKKP